MTPTRLLLLAALTGPTIPLLAQDSIPPSGAPRYLTIGLGPRNSDVSGLVAITAARDARDFTLRWTAADGIAIWSASEAVQELAFLLGRRERGRRVWSSVAAGPSVVWQSQEICAAGPEVEACGLLETTRKVKFGLALQGTAGWALTRGLGLSASLIGNVNSVDSFVGVTVNVNVGRVR